MSHKKDIYCKKVDNKIISSTRKQWEKQIEAHSEDIYHTPYLMALDWAEKIANGKGEKDSYAYALISRNNQEVIALLEVLHAKRGSLRENNWLKLMQIHAKPDLDQYLVEFDEAHADILSHAIVHCLELSISEYPSKELKIYPRQNMSREFILYSARLRKKQLALALGVHEIDVSSHGNWIVIRPGKEKHT
ncbi:MAG: hypothetical protein HQL54_06280 [Magnetococcales bacterium]|nr:hypothetical protein [Magnetococcales bacterium]